MKAIESARNFSNTRIERLRQRLEAKLTPEEYSVVLGGSYARREASEQSDLDFYVVHRPNAVVPLNQIKEILAETVKPPSTGGPFATMHSSESMQKNIGGDDDDNRKFTVRMLFLTEGEYLFNPVLFSHVREQLVRRYVRPNLKPEQIGKFFLNDTIRYYRTICVDFENKTSEQNKAWGPRNIKVVFSRKLLYVSGVIVAAELAGHDYERKVALMLSLLAQPPIDRIQSVCGENATAALSAYEHFVAEFAKQEVRDAVAQVRQDDNSRETNAIFRSLKDKGHDFSRALTAMLKSHYPEEHPIHAALIM